MPDANEPVTQIPGDKTDELIDGIGLAVSGGGYRAMLFHLGSMLRLFEIGLLKQLDGNRQERLIRWGCAVCDAAVRRYYPTQSPPAPAYPYPASGV